VGVVIAGLVTEAFVKVYRMDLAGNKESYTDI
jgi:hypothetical protein